MFFATLCCGCRGRGEGEVRTGWGVQWAWSWMWLWKRQTGACLRLCQSASSSGSGTHSAAPLNCEITVSCSSLDECAQACLHISLRTMMVMQSDKPMKHNDIPLWYLTKLVIIYFCTAGRSHQVYVDVYTKQVGLYINAKQRFDSQITGFRSAYVGKMLVNLDPFSCCLLLISHEWRPWCRPTTCKIFIILPPFSHSLNEILRYSQARKEIIHNPARNFNVFIKFLHDWPTQIIA